MGDDFRPKVNLLPPHAPPPGDIDARAHRIATRLHALPEPAMRGAVLADVLLALPVPEAAQVLTIIVQRGRQGGPPYELALSGLEELLRTERLPYPVLCDLYRELKTAELGELAVLLLPGRQHRDILGEASPRLPGERELTLGERKSLARAAPRDTIARLLRDPEPQVIRLLLRNPRIVERDVVLVAARRPIQPEVIREIMANPRWIARYAVKHTIVLNPGVPDELAARLLPSMTRQHLRELAEDPALPEVRRLAAAQLFASRRTSPDDTD